LKQLEENFINIEFTNLYYYETERELHIDIWNWKLLIFSIAWDISVNTQIEKLAIFNKDYFKIDKTNFVYIDLRIKNKVFYCSTEEKTQCEKNLKGLYN
jgi:hypothetical protein